MRVLNLGILAHIDAGKTSLTERLLYAAGVIDAVGSVDKGDTRTDSLALERQRGITIKAAVASFDVDGTTVNLIDTPGHPDFIAEVERVLDVLDGVVLVVSAVEGVQAQTRVLMRALRRLRIPTLVFVNKVDRRGARYTTLLDGIADKLSASVLSMARVDGLGTREARVVPHAGDDAVFTSALADLLADHDDAFLAAYLDGEKDFPHPLLRDELARQTRNALVHPVFWGSAITGAGTAELLTGITELLPSARGDADGPLSGTVFKIERGPAGEKIAYVRVFSGTVRLRDRLRYGPADSAGEGKVTAVGVFGQGRDLPGESIRAGQIGRLWGLGGIRVGDTIGDPDAVSAPRRHFAPPTLETVVTPRRAADRGRLHSALTQLAEQDPLIDLHQDELGHRMSLSLYGEVQKEVIQATLAEDFGVEAVFHETTTRHIERPVGTGTAAEILHGDSNPFLATVGLRIEPAPVGSGVGFLREVELGSLPAAFMKAVEETVHLTLQQGLRGWQVTDCTVTMTHSGYAARQSHSHGTFDKSMSSTAGDFRNLTPLVLMNALEQAGTQVCEPVLRFHLDIPTDTYRAVLPVLSRLRAVPRTSTARGSSSVVEGEIPAASVHALERQLPALTSGEGVLECVFAHYREVRGDIPVRPRSGPDPLHRKNYLLQVVRRVPGDREDA
ncbi:GTP-binding protein [Streptomyces sp. NPDC003247]|uniref:GTP-binding protein n=1 Tax=Streptomyces sp. NPDC003247 TaxID=3364677 RepID=UPI00368089F5